jgi:hypothetical protein
MSEAALQVIVIQLARLTGWKVHHGRPGRTRAGWRTPLMGHKGYPDLVLCHQVRKRLLFAELKAEKGKLSAEQQQWISALRAAGQDVCIWRPSDLPAIERFLRGEQ